MTGLPMPPRLLWRVGWRYLLRHPWQSALMVIGILLGVAVVVAIDLANASAARAFTLSADAVAGRATHQIVAGPQGLDEAVYARLRREGIIRLAAPIVSDYVVSPRLGNRPLQLLGVDPFAEAPFRNYLAGEGGVPVEQLIAFLTQPAAVLISTDMAARYGIRLGDTLTLEVAGHERTVKVVGLVEPADPLGRRTLEGLILADVATAQELTGRIGVLDRIDLILPPDDVGLVERIRAILPSGASVQSVAVRTGAVAQMTAAFRTNLTALSLLALVVGLFLIYNTMTFSVVRRRDLFGTLRCLGVTRREVFALVLSEAFLVGLLGAALGLVLGVLMGRGAVRLVTQTINDLFFVLTVRSSALPVSSLVKGAALGMGATALAALPPAWEAASVPPRLALSRSGLESKARRSVLWAALAGLALIGIGAFFLLAFPSRSLALSFAGTCAVIVGFASLCPLVTVALMRSTTYLTHALWGVLGGMAPRNVVNALSRTSIAVAALMVAISVTIGVSLMVGSFRHTVEDWLAQTLQGDVYISAPGVTAAQATVALDPTVLETARRWPGVERVTSLRSVMVNSPHGPLHVLASDNASIGWERSFLWTAVPVAALWEALQQGAVLVSEPFAHHHRLPLRSGNTVTLYTDEGPRDFPVVGIYYDYASTQGTVLMAQALYRRLWHDEAVTAISLRLAPGVDADAVTHALQDALASVQRLVIRPNRALRADALLIFDRTFAITRAAQVLATLVAFIGVLSALLSLQLEKQRDWGILRTLGVTTKQVWGLVMLETGLMGTAAGLLAMPTGFVLSLILIYIINRRAFGWTLHMQVEAAPFVQALAVALIAALLAGVYPARQMGRTVIVEAIRND